MDLKLRIPYIQQWNFGVQLPVSTNSVLDVGYVGTNGTRLFQRVDRDIPVDVNAVGFLPRPGVPGGGFRSNYFEVDDDEFIPTPTPECDVFDDYLDCTIAPEVSSPILGFDEDEGLNVVTSDSNSSYHALQASFRQRYTRGWRLQHQLHLVEVDGLFFRRRSVPDPARSEPHFL